MGMSEQLMGFPPPERNLRNWMLLMKESDPRGVIRNDGSIECVLTEAPNLVTLSGGNLEHPLDSLWIAVREKQPVVMQLNTVDMGKRTFELAKIELLQAR